MNQLLTVQIERVEKTLWDTIELCDKAQPILDELGKLGFPLEVKNAYEFDQERCFLSLIWEIKDDNRTNMGYIFLQVFLHKNFWKFGYYSNIRDMNSDGIEIPKEVVSFFNDNKNRIFAWQSIKQGNK